jgi:hypothetical protein
MLLQQQGLRNLRMARTKLKIRELRGQTGEWRGATANRGACEQRKTSKPPGRDRSADPRRPNELGTPLSDLRRGAEAIKGLRKGACDREGIVTLDIATLEHESDFTVAHQCD